MNETYRASELNIILKCGLAAEKPKHKIDHTGPEAALGQAVHASLDAWIQHGIGTAPQAQPWANEWGVDVGDVERLIENAPAALNAIREDLLGLQSEVSVADHLVRGRVDGLALGMAKDKLFSAAVIDWKTGRDPANSKPEQRLGYASIIESLHGMPSQGYIYTAEIWLASGDILESRWDLDAIQGFRRRLTESVKYKTASPGPHCRYCSRRHECAERDIYLRSAVSALTEYDEGAVVTDQLGELWDRSRSIKRAVEAYEKVVDDVIEHFGHLDLPDGRRLVHATKTRESIDARAAWPVMTGAGLTRDEINGALSVSKTKLAAAVAAKAQRGEKAKLKAELMTQLDLAGAITRTKSVFKKIITP